jgi:hypothetical protein
MTHYLRFPDEATGMTALEAAGFTTTDEDGTVRILTASHEHSLDVIGVITRGGVYDPDTGDVITPPTLLDGWHVNYVGEMPDGWEQYVVTPEQPVRVFAS